MGAFWAFVQGIPGVGLLIILAHVGVRVLEGLVAGPVAVLYLLILIVVGLLGNDWRRSKLLKTGYVLSKTVEAKSPEDALSAPPIPTDEPNFSNVSSSGAKWSKANDDLVHAIKKSITHPQIAADKIKGILEEKVNINAKDESGRTVLSIANYHEAPTVVRALLVEAGARE